MDAVYIIGATFAGITAVLLAIAFIVWAGRGEREVTISQGLVSGGKPAVRITGYRAEEVPVLTLDTVAFYLAAPEKAKNYVHYVDQAEAEAIAGTTRPEGIDSDEMAERGMPRPMRFVRDTD